MTKRRSFLNIVQLAIMQALILSLSGCGGGGGSTGIAVSNVQVSPAQLSTYSGGTVTIKADVNIFSSTVQAIITKPDGTKESPLTMSPLSGQTLSCTYEAPMNLRDDGQSETYSVSIIAYAGADNWIASVPVTFKVPSPAQPPLPPGG